MINKRYNGKLRKYIELEKGERFCPKCNGFGKVRPPKRIISLTCDICLGTGKLDWIEEIVGKEAKRVMLYER